MAAASFKIKYPFIYCTITHYSFLFFSFLIYVLENKNKAMACVEIKNQQRKEGRKIARTQTHIY